MSAEHALDRLRADLRAGVASLRAAMGDADGELHAVGELDQELAQSRSCTAALEAESGRLLRRLRQLQALAAQRDTTSSSGEACGDGDGRVGDDGLVGNDGGAGGALVALTDTSSKSAIVDADGGAVAAVDYDDGDSDGDCDGDWPGERRTLELHILELMQSVELAHSELAAAEFRFEHQLQQLDDSRRLLENNNK